MSVPAPPATAGSAASPAPRMPALLGSWALLAGIWVVGTASLGILVLRRVDLTASALWTAVLVSACQALALESLSAPFRLGPALVRLGGSLRAPATLGVCLLASAGLGAAHLAGGGARILTATAVLLGSGAGVLLFLAVRRQADLHAARGGAILFASVLLLAAANGIYPWLDRLPLLAGSGAPARGLRLVLALLCLGTFYGTLFRVQRALAGVRETAATWLGAAAGIGAIGLVAILLPLRLTVGAPDAERLALGTLLVLVAAGLAAAGTALFREADR